MSAEFKEIKKVLFVEYEEGGDLYPRESIDVLKTFDESVIRYIEENFSIKDPMLKRKAIAGVLQDLADDLNIIEKEAQRERRVRTIGYGGIGSFASSTGSHELEIPVTHHFTQTITLP